MRSHTKVESRPEIAYQSSTRFSRQVQKFSSSSENWWWKVSWSAIKSSINYVVIFVIKTVLRWTIGTWWKVFTINFPSLTRISVPDEIFCTLTRKSVPWWKNLYLDEKICTLTRKSVPWRENLYLTRKSELQMFTSYVRDIIFYHFFQSWLKKDMWFFTTTMHILSYCQKFSFLFIQKMYLKTGQKQMGWNQWEPKRTWQGCWPSKILW